MVAKPEVKKQETEAKEKYAKYERDYAEWQRKNNLWAKTMGGHSLQNTAGPPPRDVPEEPAKHSPKKAIDRHVQAVFQWSCGNGPEYVDFAHPQCLNGPRNQAPATRPPWKGPPCMTSDLPERQWVRPRPSELRGSEPTGTTPVLQHPEPGARPATCGRTSPAGRSSRALPRTATSRRTNGRTTRGTWCGAASCATTEVAKNLESGKHSAIE